MRHYTFFGAVQFHQQNYAQLEYTLNFYSVRPKPCASQIGVNLLAQELRVNVGEIDPRPKAGNLNRFFRLFTQLRSRCKYFRKTIPCLSFSLCLILASTKIQRFSEIGSLMSNHFIYFTIKKWRQMLCCHHFCQNFKQIQCIFLQRIATRRDNSTLDGQYCFTKSFFNQTTAKQESFHNTTTVFYDS